LGAGLGSVAGLAIETAWFTNSSLWIKSFIASFACTRVWTKDAIRRTRLAGAARNE